MYLTKPKITHLINLTNENFWKFDSLLYQEDKNIYTHMMSKLKNNNRFLVGIYQLALFGYLAPFFSKGQKLVFECYRPPWLPYYAILFMEEYACLLTIFLPINVTDFIFLSLSTLTTIQLKLLNQEFKRIYNHNAESYSNKPQWKINLRKCVEHHIFLIE